MDIEALIIRCVQALGIALLAILSCRMLGCSWSTCFLVAAIPAVLGSFNIMAKPVYVFCGILFAVACVKLALGNVLAEHGITFDSVVSIVNKKVK